MHSRTTTFGSVLVLVASGLLAAGCSSSSDENSNPPATNPEKITVDTFNVALAGAFIPHESERRQPLAEAISASPADIICIEEAWRQSDKELFIQAAKQTFPYAASVKTDLDTPLDDATDQNGQVPPEPTAAPCASSTTQEKFTKILDCLKEKCSTVPGSDEGFATSTECAQKNCVAQAAALLTGSDEDKRCYGCAAASLPTDSIGTIRSQCTTNPHAGLAFQGQNGLLILSKYPLQNPKSVVIPGTWNRRIFLAATAQVSSSLNVDVYCNHLSPLFRGITYPYTGNYGNGKTGAQAWEAEQYLQAQKLIAFVNSRTGSGRAVILGDFNTSPQYPAGVDAGEATIAADGAPTLELLRAAFPEALASDYQPKCTFCKDNVNSDADKDIWIDHILLKGFTVDAVLKTERTYDQPTVSVTEEVDGGTQSAKVPLSDHYGMRATLKLQ